MTVAGTVNSFKPTWAPILAPAFALIEGFVLGVISLIFENGGGIAGGGYSGIVLQALLGAVRVFGSMLALYRTRIITVTARFRAVVSTMMLGIFFMYLLSCGLSFLDADVPYLNSGGTFGIIISLVVIGVASMMLLVDFDMIEQGARSGAPRYMEWYGAFALLVTLILIYMEILRLLAKLRR